MDGGYYAIKGFAFQIDKYILDILNTTDENESIGIEQIQDIGSDDFVMQVKYKETQDYSDKKIREPIIQLIEEFQNYPSKRYKLYCYFKNKPVSVKQININELNSILTLSNGNSDEAKRLNTKINLFEEKLKLNFINSFYLIFAPTFQEQFEQVISKLKNQGLGSSDQESIFYYANIVDFVSKLVIMNRDQTNRKCTKKQVLDYITNGKKLVFNSAYKKYNGEEKYYKFVKSKFTKAKKNQDNFIFLGNIEIDSSVSLSDMIVDIIDRYYKEAIYDINPLTFIIPDDILGDIKREIINQNILFNDGYESIEFNENIFFKSPVKNKETAGNGRCTEKLSNISYKLRILSKSKFSEITNYKIKPQMVYYFDSEICSTLNDTSYIKIDTLNTRQIKDIFTF